VRDEQPRSKIPGTDTSSSLEDSEPTRWAQSHHGAVSLQMAGDSSAAAAQQLAAAVQSMGLNQSGISEHILAGLGFQRQMQEGVNLLRQSAFQFLADSEAAIAQVATSLKDVVRTTEPNHSRIFQDFLLTQQQFRRPLLQTNGLFHTLALDPGLLRSVSAQLSTINPVIPDLERFADAIRQMNAMLREQFRSIGILLSRLRPLLDDLLLAQQGDRSAAERLSTRISWHPKSAFREAIRLRSRIEGTSPDQVRQEALIQGLFLALSSGKDVQIPFLLIRESRWVYTNDGNLAGVSPYELDIHFFWEWVKEEACRAAEMWLVHQPYAPAMELEEPPSEAGELRLARFTRMSADHIQPYGHRGRPFGSDIFPNQASFLEEVRLAVVIVEGRGNKVTRQLVAEVLSQKGPLGPGSPESQLRRWARDFGFVNWKDLLASL
jgi:hypothetical protein